MLVAVARICGQGGGLGEWVGQGGKRGSRSDGREVQAVAGRQTTNGSSGKAAGAAECTPTGPTTPWVQPCQACCASPTMPSLLTSASAGKGGKSAAGKRQLPRRRAPPQLAQCLLHRLANAALWALFFTGFHATLALLAARRAKCERREHAAPVARSYSCLEVCQSITPSRASHC